MRILITNDDGPYSPGLKLLYDAVRELGDVVVLVPDRPRSAGGLALTLHEPLRVNKLRLSYADIYVTSGLPADAVHLAIHMSKIDLVLSGVNIGDNTSVQAILASGTLSPCFQAALLGIPAAAFSADVDDESDLEDGGLRDVMVTVCREISRYLARRRPPSALHVISVNFPSRVSKDVHVKLARPCMRKFRHEVMEMRDQMGRRHYWIYGVLSIDDSCIDSDVYVVHVEKNIALTPITLRLHPFDEIDDESISALKCYLDDMISHVNAAIRRMLRS